MSMLVVGSVALDTVKTIHGEREEDLGGSASYFSVAARHFRPVSMVAVVGEDFPPEHLGFFRERDIDTSGLVAASGKTFRWGGVYGADGNTRETLFTHLNVFADFSPQLTAAHRDCDHVFLANIHPDLQRSVLDQVKRPRLVVLDTMNYWIEGTRDSLLATLGRVDTVLLNEEEARMLTGETNLIRAARAVLDLGPSLAVIKKGEHGSLVVSNRFLFSAPSFPVESVWDPTGAGDTFAGGFVGYLAASGEEGSESEIRKATIYGTVLASFTVESFGLERLGRVSREEIEERYGEIERLTRF